MSDLSERYQRVSDVLTALRIELKDCVQYRHKTTSKNFLRAQESGYLEVYSAMQADYFARNQDFVIFYFGRRGNNANECSTEFWKIFHIENRYSSRVGRLPADYPNPEEADTPGIMFDYREVPLPSGIHGFKVDWSNGRKGAYRSPYRCDPDTGDLKILEIW